MQIQASRVRHFGHPDSVLHFCCLDNCQMDITPCYKILRDPHPRLHREFYGEYICSRYLQKLQTCYWIRFCMYRCANVTQQSTVISAGTQSPPHEGSALQQNDSYPETQSSCDISSKSSAGGAEPSPVLCGSNEQMHSQMSIGEYDEEDCMLENTAGKWCKPHIQSSQSSHNITRMCLFPTSTDHRPTSFKVNELCV